MAINKKLIHFKSKEKFNEELANANIKDTSIVFIQDSKEIWTHSQFYATPLTIEEIETIVANSPTTEELLAEIAAETSAREKAIEDTTTELTELITLEQNRAQSAEETLTTNLSNEITRSTAQDEAHDAAITKEVSDRETAITTEVNDRNNAIKVETDRAVAAEGTLQSNINTLDNELDTEVSRATNAEQALQTAIDTEVSRAKAAETELDGKITNHTTITDAALALKADKADTYTKAQVDQKVSGSYKVKGSSTFENLPTEGNVVGDVYNITNIFTLDDIEYPVGTNVVYTEEGWDALSGVFDTTKLEGDIQTVADDITKETVRAEEAEAALSTSIQTETSNREAANLTLQSNIDSVNTALSEEVSRAKTAEQQNASDITTLAGRVTTNETKLGVVQGDENTTGSINKALKDAKDYTDTTASTLRSELSSTIEGLDATVSGTDKNITVSVTETDGKLVNVTVEQDDPTVAESGEYMYGQDSSKNPVKVSNSDLASVIAGLMNTNKQFPFMRIDTIGTYGNLKDFNLATTEGIYTVNGKLNDELNFPPTQSSYGELIVYRDLYVTQIYYSTSKDIWIRTRIDDWSQWSRVDNFGYNNFADLRSNVLELPYSNYTNIGSSNAHATGWFRIAKSLDGNGIGSSCFLLLSTAYNYTKAESHVFVISNGGAGFNVSNISNSSQVQLIDKIRICADSSNWYIDIHVGLDKPTNEFYWTVIGGASSIEAIHEPSVDNTPVIFNVTGNVTFSNQVEGDFVDWYGVSWSENSSDPTCNRIGNMAMHRSLPIQSAMKGYFIVNKNGTMPDAVLPLNDYNWDQVKFGTTTNNPTTGYSTSVNGSTFVKIPEFWYIDEYIASTKTHNLKISQTAKAGWNHHKEAYVGAYEGYYYAEGRYGSTAEQIPTVSTTREAFRIAARANGYEGESKWNIYTYEEHRAICHLFLVEYATRNCQAAVNSSLTADGFRQGGLGSGCTTGTMNSAYSFIPTGTTDSLGNGSGQVAYTASNGTVYYANRYRGIENPFGHIWKHCDDVISVYNGTYRTWYKCEDPSQFATNKNSAYKPICSRTVPSVGYKKEIAATINCDFFAESTGGSESTYWCDYNYDNTDTSEHCLLIGGGSGHGGQAGLFRLDSGDGVGLSYATVGSRLTYLPWAK